MKINIGAGSRPLDGYLNLDRKTGDEAFPLRSAVAVILEGSCDEIRASHVLEHFPHGQLVEVVRDWTAKLKPGGVLKVAVPNFQWIAERYLAGDEINVQGYVMGGQSDGDDHHRAILDAELLTELLQAAGLVDVQPWESDAQDCSALPCSLNLMGRKPATVAVLPAARPLKVGAVMSVPRLGFMDNFFCAIRAVLPLNIMLRKQTGAFWGACLTRAIEITLAEDRPDAVLTIDYDSVFDRRDVEELMRLMAEHPEVDAIAPVQSSRHLDSPLMTVDLPEGVGIDRVPLEYFAGDITKLHTAHFGLTLIRASALEKLPKPWFWGQPDPDGGWDDRRTDDDTWFWRRFEEAGLRLYQANRVAIGHLELMVRWPGPDMGAIHQLPKQWQDHGKPKETWR